jgi:hypothetical protein
MQRSIGFVLLLALNVTMGAASAYSAEPAEPAPLRAAVAAAALRAAADPRVQEVAGAEPEPAADSRPFLKTGRGKAVIVLMAAVTGYAVYSRYHDRIKSPINQ